MAESKEDVICQIENTVYKNLLLNTGWMTYYKNQGMTDEESYYLLMRRSKTSTEILKKLEPKVFDLTEKCVFFEEQVD